ncbi:tetratricopeptide repeat-containing protein [Leisingera sp. MMG026]|uniref:tetratricopeptide repeat-containing protein n=1 Tax=Leisingera sp. MMG026 TaxID=2909982 RepID=UPI001F290F0C|nr:tetratricopeptide repeat-containing protein [Leisingera sp. MMG026]MCF6433251.1 tetratricopeptide repeat-containing protein [Leisingera sp. MMG026]
MSFTAMNTSAPRIWGFKPDAEMRIAREAGWSRADLIWERLMERALAEAGRDRPRKAMRLFRLADIVARVAFAAIDLRRAAPAANLAVLQFRAGASEKAERLQARALAIWAGADGQVDAMQIAPRSRSSLFHLRMEALHRDTFHANLKTRVGRIAAETGETLRSLTSGWPVGHRHASRWRGEKPVVFDGTRKVLGACLLLLDD